MLKALKTLSTIKAGRSRPTEGRTYKPLPKAVESWMNSWPLQHGSTDILRASGMAYLCPREFIFNYWIPRPHRSFDSKSQLLMSMGTHIHYYLQNCVLGPMGILYGNWQTVKDRDRLFMGDSFHPDPEQAQWAVVNQKSLRWEYVEPEVWDKHWRISGHIDGFLSRERIFLYQDLGKEFTRNPRVALKKIWEIEAGKLSQLEVKTTGSFIFKGLETVEQIPDYYKMQAGIYQHLSKVTETIFWYMNRDNMTSKILVYPYDKGQWQDVRRKASVVWRSIRDETLPDTYRKCLLPRNKRAKACAFCEHCFDSSINRKFRDYVKKAKSIAADKGRKLLDLSNWSPDSRELEEGAGMTPDEE